jgi:hypothetical protein
MCYAEGFDSQNISVSATGDPTLSVGACAVSFIKPEARGPEPWLVWDNRPALAKQGLQGMHALICGLSGYPNLPPADGAPSDAGLGMRQLSSTALTAHLILDWLLRAEQSGRLHLPLATCRVLLTPVAGELASAPALGNSDQSYRPTMQQLGAPGCTFDRLALAAKAWRDDASASADCATFFYFAGHGIQRERREQVIILEGFGGAGRLLQEAADVSSIYHGMAPTAMRPNIGRTQFYFVDACRNLPSAVQRFERLTANSIFDVEISTADYRRAPIFYSAPPGTAAQAVPRVQTLFSLALLKCLNGGGAWAPRDDGVGLARTNWYINSESLNLGLKSAMSELNRQYGGNQGWIVDGVTSDAILSYLPSAPQVPVWILVEPQEAVASTTVRVFLGTVPTALVCTFPSVGFPHPYQSVLTAGQYEFEAVPSTPPYRNQKRLCIIAPLASRVWRLNVQ